MSKSISPMSFLKPGTKFFPASPRSHRSDEFAAGYSSAVCSPALPASALPAGFHLQTAGSYLSTDSFGKISKLDLGEPTRQNINVRGGPNQSIEVGQTGISNSVVLKGSRLCIYRPHLTPYLTTTLTWALVQQHWNPPPPSPDQSLPATRRTYSPGSLKAAVVAILPVNAVFGGGGNSAFSAGDLAGLKVTVPGPRNLVHVTVTGGSRLCDAEAPGTFLASSATHAASESGCPTVAVIAVVMERGPCAKGPVSANPT